MVFLSTNYIMEWNSFNYQMESVLDLPAFSPLYQLDIRRQVESIKCNLSTEVLVQW